MSERYVERILRARVYDVARETPLECAPRLSARLQNQVWLKREDLQPVFSFKLRGASNRIALLPEGQARRGVIAASAGNHGQGVALAAARRGLRAVIVMPTTTPRIKVEAVQELGAEIELSGDDYDDAHETAVARAAREGLVLIHPYDDPEVIAGQGTIAVEILRQHPAPIDALFVPVGGGGLAAGIATYVKFLRPEIAVIGVEPSDAASLYEALRAGHPVELSHVGIFADGVAVRRVGDETFSLLRERIDDMVLVDTDEICGAIQAIYEDTRAIAEPAGALAVAGLRRWAEERGARDRTLIAIQSGANMNFHGLRHVSERAELGERREAILAVTIPERPGSFRAFCEALGPAVLTEFNYRYADPERAHVFVGMRLERGLAQRDQEIARLRRAGYAVVDMTDNEMAKVHGRHLVGGIPPAAFRERVLRFEFPERPGALLRFLQSLSADWNITLFHYRNHGAARGRVLCGLQVPESAGDAFERFLRGLRYPHWEETANPSYRLFLQSPDEAERGESVASTNSAP
jgi:threonine dehydratase